MKINLLPKKQAKQVTYKTLHIFASLALIFNMSMVGVFFVPNEAQANGPTGTYSYSYIDHQNNIDGTSTWNYRVDEIDLAKQVSHLGLETCFSKEELNSGVLINTNPAYNSIGDSSTAHPDAIKWEGSNGFTEGNGDESWNVSITFDQWYGVDPQGATGIVKNGTLDNTGDSHGTAHLDFIIKGPDCEPIETEPEFNIKKYVQLEGANDWKNLDEDNLSVTAEPGDDVTFMIKLWNTGTGEGTTDITDVVTNGSDSLFSSITRIQPTNITLAGGAFTEPGFTVGGATDGSTNYYVYTYLATIKDAQATEGWYYAINTATATQNNDDSQAKVKTLFECDLEIEKYIIEDNNWVTSNSANPGDTITYLIRYKNNGDANCTGTGVKIYDELFGNISYSNNLQLSLNINPDSVTPIPDPNGNFDGKTNKLLYNVGVVSPGEEGIITFEATIDPDNQCGDLPDVENRAWSDGNEPGSDQITEWVVTDVSNPPCTGSITVIKNVEPDDNTSWDFNLTGPTPSSVNLSDGDSHPFNDRTPGTYNLTESTDPNYTMSVDCGDTPVTSITDGVSFKLSENGNVTCTFTNTRDTGDFTIYKYDEQQNPQEGVTFNVDGSEANVSGQTNTNGMLVFNDLPTGNYTVTETEPSNYHFSTVTGDCSPNANPTYVDITTSGQSCTFTNARDTAHLTLVKVVTNNNGGTAQATEWTLSADGPTPISGDGGVSDTVLTGTYTLSEFDGPSSYTASDWECDGGTLTGDEITLGLDDDVTCTITNDDIAPKLKLIKYVTNDNGGTLQVSNFPLFINGQQVTSGDWNTVVANVLYTATETSDPGYTPSNWGGDCNSDGTITLQPGDEKICTITNDDQSASLTVIKTVINDDGGTAVASDFTMNVTGTNVSNPSFAGAENPGVTVTLDAGSYSVDEAGMAGYDKTLSADCSGTIANGEHKTCTVTNDDIQVDTPELTLTKVITDSELTTGGFITYQLTYENTGSVNLTNVQIIDDYPQQYVTVTDMGTAISDDGNVLTWDIGDLAIGQDGTVAYTVSINENTPADTDILNIAVITSDQTGPVQDAAVTEIPPVPGDPVLTITKSVDKDWVNPGDTVTYTVTVGNTGNDTAINTQLTDLLPAGFTFVDNGNPTQTWSLGNLAAGTEITVTYKVNVGDDVTAGNYDNLAVTWADNHGNVTDTVPVEVRIPTVLAEEALPVLEIVKTVDKEFINPGDTVTYTVKVTNVGDASAFAVAINVRVQDIMPAGFTFEDGEVTKVWSLGDLAVGESIEITYTAIADTTVLPGQYENLAVAWADNHGNITDSVDLEVREPIVLGEELPTTGGGIMHIVYIIAAGLIFLFSLYVLKLTTSKERS